MTDIRRTIKIFFSWQSDLDQSITTRAIRSALRSAMNDIENAHPVDILLDEATSNVPGAPYIPFALAEKISRADIFVGDISTVASYGVELIKNVPNANVTFELGIASAELGWHRIVMLFNESLSQMENLPFDFDRHRISKFKFSSDATKRKQHEGELRVLLRDALLEIVSANPKRPRELKDIPPDKLKHARDAESLRWFLQKISTSYLDQHINDMPKYLNYSAIAMAENLELLLMRSDFLFYDSELSEAVFGVADSLRETLAYEGHYRDTTNPYRQSFGRPGDLDMHDNEQTAAWDKIDLARRQLKQYLDNLIGLVRQRFLEINLDETNSVFAGAYNASLQDDGDNE